MSDQGRLLDEVTIDGLEAEAIDFIRAVCSGAERVGVGFSGGKDSVVVMELMKRAGVPFTSFYNATQIDPPEVVRFIRRNYPDVEWVYPKTPFFRKILTSAPPLRRARWCCGHLKHNSRYNNQFDLLILGVRAEESFKRRGYPRFDTTHPRQPRGYPIFEWTMADVWEYIDVRGLPYCSLYDEGFDRLGCVPCLYKSEAAHRISRARWPGLYKAFEHAVTKWFRLKQDAGIVMAYDTPEEFIEDWYKGRAIWYRSPNKV